MIMPGMNGRVLAEHVTARLPHIRVLFVSGYPQDVMVDGASNAEVNFLAKPYSLEQLDHRVGELLAGTDGAKDGHAPHVSSLDDTAANPEVDHRIRMPVFVRSRAFSRLGPDRAGAGAEAEDPRASAEFEA